jgi:hypothetical protein
VQVMQTAIKALAVDGSVLRGAAQLWAGASVWVLVVFLVSLVYCALRQIPEVVHLSEDDVAPRGARVLSKAAGPACICRCSTTSPA